MTYTLDASGHATWPEGTKRCIIKEDKLVTSVTFPYGCIYAVVYRCHSLTSVTFLKGCAYALFEHCHALVTVAFQEKTTVWRCRASIFAQDGHACALIWGCPKAKTTYTKKASK